MYLLKQFIFADVIAKGPYFAIYDDFEFLGSSGCSISFSLKAENLGVFHYSWENVSYVISFVFPLFEKTITFHIIYL